MVRITEVEPVEQYQRSTCKPSAPEEKKIFIQMKYIWFYNVIVK